MVLVLLCEQTNMARIETRCEGVWCCYCSVCKSICPQWKQDVQEPQEKKRSKNKLAQVDGQEVKPKWVHGERFWVKIVLTNFSVSNGIKRISSSYTNPRQARNWLPEGRSINSNVLLTRGGS